MKINSNKSLALEVNAAVNGTVAMVASTPKAVRSANRAYRAVITKLAYVLARLNGSVSALNVFTVVKGLTVADINATVSSIRSEISRNLVEANTTKLRLQAAA
jgi:hypothetical protein